MPYISELLDQQVYDSADKYVGKLQDILILPKNGAFSPLEFLAIKIRFEKTVKFVPYDFLENFSSRGIILKNLFETIVQEQLPEGQYIYLKRDVLDRQIVDLAGTRVVRVNDLRIGNFENRSSVVAIDSSFRGILRRFKLTDSFLAIPFKVNLIDWRQAQLIDNGPLQLNTSSTHLSRLHPADLANIIEELNVKQGSKLLVSLNAEEAAKVLEEVDPQLQNVLVKYLGPEQASKILAQMPSDEAADLVKSLSTEEAGKFLSKLEKFKATGIQKLAEYPDNTAGGLMTLDYVSVRPEWTVAQVVEIIKKLSPRFRSIVFVYVTDEDGKFFGVVSLRRLFTTDPTTSVSKLVKAIRPVATLNPDDKIRRIIKVMTKYNLFTAAVVDLDKKLIGIVTIDDVMRLLFPDA